MTEDRQVLIDKFQRWLDTNPRKQIIAAECANIAEKYAEQLLIQRVSNLLCGSFDPDLKTSSATKCKCGREKWEHPKDK